MLTTALRSLNLAAAACAALAAGAVLWATLHGEAVTVLGWSNGLAAPTVQAVAEPVRNPSVPVQPRTDMERFAVDLAAALGNAQPSPELLLALQAWHEAEGGAAAFNPFNTTEPWPGSSCYNSVCVRNYPSYDDGLKATVQTLRYDFAGYAELRQGIATNTPALIWQGLAARSWGTNAALAEQVYTRLIAAQRDSQRQGAPDSAVHGAPLHGPLVVTQGFGVGTHAPADIWGGVDYAAQTGDPLYAIIDGTADVSQTWPCGLGLKIKGPTYQTLYCHMSRVDVVSGATVTAGQAVGAAGASGEATASHLHLEIRENGKIIDPTNLIHEMP